MGEGQLLRWTLLVHPPAAPGHPPGHCLLGTCFLGWHRCTLEAGLDLRDFRETQNPGKPFVLRSLPAWHPRCPPPPPRHPHCHGDQSRARKGGWLRQEDPSAGPLSSRLGSPTESPVPGLLVGTQAPESAPGAHPWTRLQWRLTFSVSSGGDGQSHSVTGRCGFGRLEVFPTFVVLVIHAA